MFHVKPGSSVRAPPVEKSAVPVEDRAHPARPARWITLREPPAAGAASSVTRTSFPPSPQAVTLAARARHGPPGPRSLWTSRPDRVTREDLRWRHSAAARSAGRGVADLVSGRAPLHRQQLTRERRTSGIPQPTSRPNGASARAVTTSNRSSPCSSSARPRTTRTLAQPELVDRPPRRNAVRRRSGSTSVIDRSGPADRQDHARQPGP